MSRAPAANGESGEALSAPSVSLLGEIVESLCEPSEDQEKLDGEIGRCLALIASDRQSQGTLIQEPIDELDVMMAGLLTLLARLERGDEITIRQRRALAAMLRFGLTETMSALTRERARREASRRGGQAGRTADPARVIKVWREKLVLCNGKRTEADEETARELHLSPRTVRHIRLAVPAN